MSNPAWVEKSWWLWNGATPTPDFEQCLVQARPVRIARAPAMQWYVARNPLAGDRPDRQWLVAEGGTGYVLGYGATMKGAEKNSRARFFMSGDCLGQSDCQQYVRTHLRLLLRYKGHTPGFQLPSVQKSTPPAGAENDQNDLIQIA